MQKLPVFLGIGAQRAGTTWLHNCLKEHPQLCLPEKKEVHFFDLQFDKGLDWYQQQFSHAQPHQLIGEITPNYYHEDNALERIKETLPDVKLIYVLREPVSRSYSQYQLYKQEIYVDKSFKQVLDEDETIYEYSRQGKHLERVYSMFNRDNVLVLFYDEINSNPENVLFKVCQFLGVATEFSPSFLNRRVNAVVLPQFQAALAKFKLTWLIDLVKKSPLAEPLKTYLNRKPKGELTRELQNRLKQEFLSDIEKVERLAEIDLSHWK